MKNFKQHIVEGRPSQRHPLEGHEYHKKTDAELVYIAKDAHKAAEAMKGHNTAAENKYRDQANDSATVRYFRQKNGMPDWYKKKYGHVKEEVEQIEEKTTSVNGIPVGAEVASEVENMKKEIRKEQGAWQMDTGWKKIKPQTPDKSGAVHKPTSRAKHLAQKAKEITAKKIKLGMLK